MNSAQVFFVYRSNPVSLPTRNNSNPRRFPKDLSKSTDQRVCTKENCLTCCKKFTAFMFSRVGLFLVMIGYVAVGGWLFQILEAGNEQIMRRSMSLELNTTLYRLWEEILRVNSFPYLDKKGNFTSFATEELEKFEVTVIQQVQQGFDGRTRTDADTDWNYFGAILYAVTLISTIGYGHITTKTTAGKIATILYSAFGVPLMMLFVANIGSTMAKMFTFVFSRFSKIVRCRWKKKRKRSPSKVQTEPIVEEKPIEIVPKSNLKRTRTPEETNSTITKERQSKLRFEDELLPPNKTEILPADVRLDLLTGVSFSKENFQTKKIEVRSKNAVNRINDLIRENSVQIVDDENENLETTEIQVKPEENLEEKKQNQTTDENENDSNKSTNKINGEENLLRKNSRRRFFSKKIKKQNAIDESSANGTNEDQRNFSLSPPNYEESTNRSIQKSTINWKNDNELLINPTKLSVPNSTRFDQEIFDEDDEQDEQASVPLLVTVFVIPLYLTLGAILFDIWENWGFLNSFYFCFITLTTIGFGDFVPGSALTVSAAKEKLISAALYILIGLVLLAMCFNLVKEQVTQKFKRVAGKWSMRDI